MEDDEEFNPSYHEITSSQLFTGSSSIKTPALIELVREGGLSITEIQNMGTHEFQDLVVVLGSQYGSTFEEIKKKFTEKVKQEEEKDLIQQQLEGKIRKQEQIQNSNPPSLHSSQQINTNPIPQQTPIFVNDQDPIPPRESAAPTNYYPIYKHIKNDKDIVRERGFEDLNQLNQYRLSLVRSLIPVGARYSDVLNQLAKEHLTDIKSGFLVAVNLQDGKRIQKYFHKDHLNRELYIWCAKQDSLIRDKIQLGQFILMKYDGEEIDPTQQMSTLSNENRIHLFLRVLF